MVGSVQFFGKPAVLKAVENRECPKWAIFQGQQFLFKYQGDSMDESCQFLDQLLDSLQHSNAVYRIQFYEDDIKSIKANSPHDGSFNFRPTHREDFAEVRENRNTGYNAIIDKLTNIEARLSEVVEDDDEEDRGLAGIALGLLKEPEKLGHLINIGRSLLSGTQQAATVNGVPGSQDDKINQAIAILKNNDPKLGDHLFKLAEISEKKKTTYSFLISQLEKL